MFESLLRKAKDGYEADGKDSSVLRQSLPILHREYLVRRKIFGEENLTADIRQVGTFLDAMRKIGLLAKFPISYDIHLTRKEIDGISQAAIPREKFRKPRKKKGKKSQRKKSCLRVFQGGAPGLGKRA
jgi:hypothetical protein